MPTAPLFRIFEALHRECLRHTMWCLNRGESRARHEAWSDARDRTVMVAPTLCRGFRCVGPDGRRSRGDAFPRWRAITAAGLAQHVYIRGCVGRQWLQQLLGRREGDGPLDRPGRAMAAGRLARHRNSVVARSLGLGKGYATEAATRCVDWAFGALGWDEVIHTIDRPMRHRSPSRCASDRSGAVRRSCRRRSNRGPPISMARIATAGSYLLIWIIDPRQHGRSFTRTNAQCAQSGSL